MALTIAAVAGATALVVVPQHRALVGYAAYAIPAHMLISFLSHEPALFAIAKLYPPQVVATVGISACVVATLLDYWLIGWFVSRKLVRARFEGSRAYAIAHRIFHKAPFVLVLVSAFLPVPFYPVKVLAIANNYSATRFIVAMALGRWPRFVLLAIGGRKVNPPNRLLVWAAVALAAIMSVQLWRARHQRSQS